MALSRIIHGMENVVGYKTELKSFLKPIICIVGLTKRCNLKCKMCDVWKEQPTEDILTLEDFEKLFSGKILRNIGSLLLSGGEPFLRKDVVEICSIARQNIPHLEEIRFVSNGTMAERTVSSVRRVLEDVGVKVYLKISIDGKEATHDSIRGIPGIFSKAMQTMDELKELRATSDGRLSLAVGFTVMDENIDEIWDVYEEFSDVEFFFKPVQDYILVGKGDKLKGSHIGASESTRQKLIKFIEEYIKKEFDSKGGLMSSIQKQFYLYQLEFIKNPKSLPFPCTAGYSSVAVYPNGDVQPCTMTGTAPVGNIKKETLDEIWYSDKMNAMRKEVKKGKCRCWAACNMYPSLVTTKWKEIGFDYLSHKIHGR